MTKWARFYRWLGGKGPEDPELRPTDAPRLSIHHLAWILLRCGFLSRDPNLLPQDASWLVNYRWQWRFWRGPYADCLTERRTP